MQEQQHRLVARVHGRERRTHGRRQPRQHVGDVPHGRRAEEDLGAGLQGQQLEGCPRGLPERAAAALRPRDRLRDVRILHRGDQRPRAGEPIGLPGLRGRQRAGAGRCRHERGLGYFGFSYYEENQSRLKALQVQNPKTGQCVDPVDRHHAEQHATSRSRGRSSSTRRARRSAGPRCRRSSATSSPTRRRSRRARDSFRSRPPS